MRSIGVNVKVESPGWKKILSQEGVPIDPRSDIWILDKKTSELRKSLEKGCLVLTPFKNLDKDVRANIRRIVDGPFGYSAGEIGNGYIIALSFDPSQLFYKKRRIPFYSEYGYPPDEVVASVNTKGIRRTVVGCIRELFSRKGIPYVHKWYYPRGKSLFSLRVDTDFSTAEEVIDLQESLQKLDTKATIFLNSLVLKNRLRDILRGDHTYAVHCYYHSVYPDRMRNYTNIKRAKELLEKAGGNLRGFAAPYGIWHVDFPSVLEELGLSYSSEFTLAYDDLPFRPDLERDVLQIPIHPICPERLFMSKHSEQDVIDYYISLTNRNHQQGEPTIIYSHPTALIENFKMLQEILGHATQVRDIWFADMDEIDIWWRDRQRCELKCSLEENTLIVDASTPIPLEIILPDGKRCILDARSHIDLSKARFTTPPPITSLPEVHSSRPRLILRELEARYHRYRNRRLERSKFS